MAFVLVYPPSTAIPTFSVASSNPPLPSSPILKANPFIPPPISPQSLAASLHRFINLLFTFSSDPDKWAENLAVKASESRNLWSGFCSETEEAGNGRDANKARRVAEVGSEAGTFKAFFGRRVRGGECSTSDQGTSRSKNRRKMRSVEIVLCAKHRFRKMASIRLRRATRAASSLALPGLAPAMA